MKRIMLTFFAIAAIALTTFGQAPSGFTYQSVLRDANNDLIINTAVGTQISILQTTAGGTAVYVETHAETTNANGLLTLQVGAGSVQSGTFANIDWSAGPYFVKAETDPAGGATYTITGTQQMMSVPYALYAETSGTGGAAGADGPTGPQGPTGADGATGATGSLAAGTTAGNTPYWNGTQWVLSSSNVFNNGGNVGVGTSSPASKLDVNGGLTVGSFYSGFYAAPANLALIHVCVGVRTSSPATRLAVNGGLTVGSFYSGFHAAPANLPLIHICTRL